MNTTVKALQALYIKLGGALTDTYETIADGAPVGNYNTIPDMIEACTQKAGSGGGSGGTMILTGTSDETGSYVTVDGEYSEYSEVFANGGIVFLDLYGFRFSLIKCESVENQYSVIFSGILEETEKPVPVTISYSGSGAPVSTSHFSLNVPQS